MEIILLIIILIIIIYIYIYQKNERMIDIPKINQPVKWTVNKNCNYHMNETIRTILEKHKIKHTSDDDWVLYIPCTYNNLRKEIADVKPNRSTQRIFLIDNADEISGKNTLWSHMVTSYGRD